MFTGLIQATGAVGNFASEGNYRVLTVVSDLADDAIELGESIACDGACLTVVACRPGQFVVEASQETVVRTILKDYRKGQQINLERALRVGDRMGGHFVTGHIDEVGVVQRIRKIGRSVALSVQFSKEHEHLVIDKGSIAINGLSLTVNAVRSGVLSVNVIPRTWANTTLSNLRQGQAVNLEFDLIGKFVSKQKHTIGSSSLTMDKLIESGW